MSRKCLTLILNRLAPVVILLAGLLMLVTPLQAQKSTKVFIEHADLLKIAKVKGMDVQILMGNAILRQDSTLFYCDTATLDARNNLTAVGRIHISYGDSVHLYGDYLTYSGNSRIAVLDSNVRMVDPRATLYSDHLEFDRNTSIARYFTGGRIVDEENELTSIKGRYFTQRHEFVFSDSVVAVNPEYTMYSDTLRYNTDTEVVFIEGPTRIIGKEDRIYSEKGWYDTRLNQAELCQNNNIEHLEQILRGDWIFYDREKEYGIARGNVWIKDTKQDIILEGGVSEFFRERGYSYITDSARAIMIERYDSLYMHADSFILILDSADKAKFLFAYHKMKFFRDDLQGICDSLVFRVQDSVIAFLKDPVLWSEENQMTADSIWMYVSSNRIDSMVLFNTAFIVSRDSTESFNQVKGKQMRAYFRDNELHRIRVLGNAETIYYVREDDLELIGINKSVSSTMVILLEDRKIEKIYYLTQPESTLFPEKELPKDEQYLKDFKWITFQRPSSMNDIYIWKDKDSEN